MKIKPLVLAALGFLSLQALGATIPSPGNVDARVRDVNFNPNEVYKITAFYGYDVTLMFNRDEHVMTLTAGYADAWEVSNHGYFVTLKPKDKAPDTDFVVITDRHTYVFDLRAQAPLTQETDSEYATDSRQIYLLRFHYPDDDRVVAEAEKANELMAQETAERRAAERERKAAAIAKMPAPPHNTAYFYEGEDGIAPYEAWDNGTFTYLRFYAQRDRKSVV